MDENYDVIVLGTGLKECLLSAMLSKSGMKVLHLDRNKFFGGESASLTSLEQLCKHFKSTPIGEKYGKEGDWSVDLTQKLLFGRGQLSKLLVYIEASTYVDFQLIEGSYVYKGGESNEIFKVPFDEKEALASKILGIFEKRRLKAFLNFVKNFDASNPKSWKGIDPSRTKASKVFANFELVDDAIDFIGHAIALYTTDTYLERPVKEMLDRCLHYIETSQVYPPQNPYVYPVGGLGTLLQGLVKSGARCGSTCILDKPVEEIVMKRGKAVGVTVKGQTTKCQNVVCDPSYALDRCRKSGQVVRAICILNHPIPNTDNARSVQIIIPQKQVGRKHDIYVCMVSSDFNVCAKNFYIATVATTVETDDPEEEIKLGLELLGPIEDKFVSITDMYEPLDDGTDSRIFISRSYDATTHLGTTLDDILNLYTNIAWSDFDFSMIHDTLIEI